AVLFVCENNEFATEVPFREASGNPSVSRRGAAYGMPGVEVDGNDVLAVKEAARWAVQRARGGEGPTLLECKTYRTRPHSEGMGDFTYRTREDVEKWKKLCPILTLGERIVSGDSELRDDLGSIDAEVQKVVEAAHAAAEASAWPKPESAATHIYAAPT